jgi:hypothetical protein
MVHGAVNQRVRARTSGVSTWRMMAASREGGGVVCVCGRVCVDVCGCVCVRWTPTSPQRGDDPPRTNVLLNVMCRG